MARVENAVDLSNVLLDSGADVNVVSRGLIKRLQEQGVTVHVEKQEPHKLATFDGGVFEVTQMVHLDVIQIQTTAGPLLLRRTPAWVFEQDTTRQVLILSRPVMERLGYSVDAILARACDTQPEWDLQDLAGAEGKPFEDIHLIRDVGLHGPDPDLRAATPGPTSTDPEELISRILRERVSEAAAAGLDTDQVTRLEGLFLEYRDVFRVSFGTDPPVRVEPLRVRVREGAAPVRINARRYPPVYMQYLDEHVQELLDNGLAYVNPSSRWASPPRIVTKNEPGTYRMTVDTRAVNDRTEPIQWPMPMLESALGLLEGTSCYFTLDWFRGYWQLPLHKDSQEMCSIMTHRGIITPTRVLMGGTDAVAYCQHVVEEVFRPILYHGVLAWLDDILGYAADPVNLLEVLERVLAACRSFGLKLHPAKCLREARWCGKIVSGHGIKHCPSRIEGLVSMPDPTNAGQLQQFMCAVNWMRQNIARYSELAAPLLEIVDAAAKRVGSRKMKQMCRVLLSDLGWNQKHVEALKVIRSSLLAMVPLAHPDPSKAVALFTDASQDFWSAVCTQDEESELEKPFDKQNHRPLAFLSGRFTGAQLRWPTIEKEAYAIVESVKRLEYLLLRPGGFHLFTDHRNLAYIFNPSATDGSMQRYQADKLQRWAMAMTSYRYVIEHIRGDDNAWADMLSRWGNPQASRIEAASSVKQIAVVPQLSPLEDEAFEWPTIDEIRNAQQQQQQTRPEEDLCRGSCRSQWTSRRTDYYCIRRGLVLVAKPGG
ncbi:hypothetical protein PR002_g24168 [Phytophthora rubi]|uniref:RNA-directed DNA polymerase n=2 Tax=Phytophthora rubi TaxID=129364 RepID=A0A6A3IIB7_9STRA|nr:hypothetical protein PR002_g24168 [Phytophthora rubi]